MEKSWEVQQILSNIKKICSGYIYSELDITSEVNEELFDSLSDLEVSCLLIISDSESEEEVLRSYRGLYLEDILDLD